MSLDQYQDFCPETFIKGETFEIDLAHITNGLYAETGEVAAAYQKFYRGDYDEEELKKRLSKEIGGLMYHIAMLCNLEGFKLSNIIAENAEILCGRKERGVIQGDGDER